MIVLRKDLGMRCGKMVAQGAHAVEMVLDQGVGLQALWRHTGRAKICCRVESEDELLAIYKQAQAANLPCSLVRDAGRTEFSEPTYTAVAIGPCFPQHVDPITGDLRLL